MSLDQNSSRTLGTGFLLSLILAFGPSCGGESVNSGASGDLAPLIAEVRVTPGTGMLTEVGQSVQLSAQAFDAEGSVVVTDFSWQSSRPDQLSVDADGRVTAMAIGSAEIWAKTDLVRSNSALFLASSLAPGAQPVTDDQLVGLIEIVDPAAPYGVGLQLRMTLQGMAPPAVGEILVGTGEAPIGGRVIAVETVGADVLVTLEMIPISEMFDEIVLDEEIDLASAEIVISETASEFYDVETDATGRMIFTLKATKQSAEAATFSAKSPVFNAQASRQRAAGAATSCEANESALGPFCCQQVPFLQLTLSPSISFERDLSLPIVLKPDNSLQKIALKGRIKAEIKQTMTITSALEGGGTCKMELAKLQVPFPGPLGLVLGGTVPVGIGFEVGGKFPLAGLGWELAATAEVTAEVGYQCPTSQCGFISDFNSSGSAGVNPIASVLILDGLRMETKLGGFGFAGFEVGASGGKVASFFAGLSKFLSIDLFELKAGPVIQGKHAEVKSQVLDEAYKSSHQLSFDTSLTGDQNIGRWGGVMGVSFLNPAIEISEIISTGPTAASAEASAANYQEGDTLAFEVELDPETVNFTPFVYNVEAIHIYRMASGEPELVASERPASAGQLQFGNLDSPGESLSWTATEAGTVAGNFFAFVDTGVFCSGECDSSLGKFLGRLELLPAASSSCPPAVDNGRFASCGDCTIEDEASGLLWEGKTTTGGVHDVTNTYTWSSTGSAADGTAYTVFLAGLNGASFAGHRNWRLPIISELQSILVGPGVETVANAVPADPNSGLNGTGQPTTCAAVPCIDPDFAAIGGSTASHFYWSVSRRAPGPQALPLAWAAGFASGEIGPGVIWRPGASLGFYRAVRAGSCSS